MARACTVRPEQLPQIREDYRRGLTYEALAAKHGVSRQAINRALVGAKGRVQAVPEAKEARVVADYRAGLSLRQVAEKHHLTRDVVHRIVREAGVVRSKSTAYELRFPDACRQTWGPEHALVGGRWVQRGLVQVWETS